MQVIPAVHALSLGTSVASVRVNCFMCLGKLVPKLEEPVLVEIAATAAKTVAVDRSVGTLMCVLGVADIMSKHCSVQLVAEQLLPMLIPATVVPALV